MCPTRAQESVVYMGIFSSKSKAGYRSVNFTFSAGLPEYQPGDAINATINTDENMLIIKARVFKRPEITLSLGRITEVSCITETEIIEKNKSVVGRAAIGALFGPAAAVIGGMSGIGTKKDCNNRHYLIIKYTNAADDSPIVLEIVGASIGWDKFLKELDPRAKAPAPTSVQL